MTGFGEGGNTATVKSHTWVYGVQVPLITEKISRSEITVRNYFEEVIPLSTGFQTCWGEVRSHLDSRGYVTCCTCIGESREGKA